MPALPPQDFVVARFAQVVVWHLADSAPVDRRSFAHAQARGPPALVARNERTVEFLRRFMNLGMARRPAMLFRRVEDARRWLDRIAIEEGLRAPARRPGEPHGARA